MPKAEKGSLKDIGKRIKAKGLQKLRFWCEMCSKQCRDANGFKCHLTSESHLRQMKLFSEHAGQVVKQKSTEFEKLFLDTLRLRHSTVMVNANNVYQEIIRDKAHVHMNATHWATLSDFVQYLGKYGKCKVEETERGWYIQYRPVQSIQQQDEAFRKQQQAAADEQAEEEYQERMQQLRREQQGTRLVLEPTKLETERIHNIKVDLSLSSSMGAAKGHTNNTRSKPVLPSVFGSDHDDDDDEKDNKAATGPPPIPTEMQHNTKTTQLPPNNDSNQVPDKDDEEEPWLMTGIQVRIVRKKSEYFKQKAVVTELLDPFTARVVLLRDSGATPLLLSLDQRHLETVVPKANNTDVCIIVKGPHRGVQATVIQMDKTKQRAVLQILHHQGVVELDLDDFSAQG